MSQTETLIRLYTDLLTNQGLITPAPVLRITKEQLAQNPDESVMMQDLLDMACSLLAVPSDTRDTAVLINSLNQRYPNPTSFWRAFISDIIGLIDPAKRPQANGALVAQGQQILRKLNDYISNRNAIIAICEKKIEEAHFPVDAHALLLNYINMARRQPEQAWEILTTTPAYFSPIITTDKNGKTIISADKGKQWNTDLAQFLKNLTV